ncbi:myb-like protein V [Ischnura elegans]|uniref:myb-like protein V n=1 Tax=Ischnura elegans TaxID=197161 RepID=UPI001ED8BAE6|nr:myb-like protein V [Ischnura elegans]XP_046390996.1 myb-like protein V [Ischnura elegans]XP_046390997.1 myb-like protein V [Ischnura elegans]XP_046390998.1 myb-like protein V [Ischnura elegans]
MFSFHKPKVYRSSTGCCICRAKSSSSRFTDSKKYEEDFVECFKLHERRTGEICNACVLLVKRWKKLPAGSERNWKHVVDARAGPGTKSLTKFKSKNKKKPKLKAEAIPVASSLSAKVNGGSSNLVNHSSLSMGNDKSKKKHMYMKSHSQRNSGGSSSICKATLAGGNGSAFDRQRNHYRGIRDSSPGALSDIGGEEDFLYDHSPSPSPSDLNGMVDTRRKNHRIKPKLRAGGSPKQQQTRIQGRSVVRHSLMSRHDEEEEEEDPEEYEEEEEEEEEDEEEELYEEITRRKRNQRGFPVALHHQRSSRNRSRSPVQRQTGERKCNPSRRSQVSVSPQISSFLDMTFWKREEVCCGIIFKGPNQEVIVDPRFLKPCIGCRKPLIMQSSASVQSAPVAVPPADSPPLQSPPPAPYPPNSPSGAIPPASSSSQSGGLQGPASSSGNKQSTKSFSDSSSDSGYDESSNPGADGAGLNANRRPSAGVIVSAGEVSSRGVVGADLGGVPYQPAISVAPASNYIPKSRPPPGDGIAPSND